MSERRVIPSPASRLTGQQFYLPMDRDQFVLGLFIPQSGPAGIWGPSCRACGELAIHEINLTGGIGGLELVAHIVDAGGDPSYVAEQAETLFDDGEIDAVAGMHTSDVRDAIAERLKGRVPYIYTPLYEGGVNFDWVCCIGETPDTQLFPALYRFANNQGGRRWALIGNDYIWPRRSHELTRWLLGLVGAEVIYETYHPFGTQNFDSSLQVLEDLQPDVLLLSLVGDDSVRFNRAFSNAGLANHTIRLSCAVEENMLLAIGANNTERLYCSSGYFNQIPTSENGIFLEIYHQHFGDSAPTLNALGESVYEGVHFLANCLREEYWNSDRLCVKSKVPESAASLSVPGPKRSLWKSGVGAIGYSVYLAEAEGHEFSLRGVLNPLRRSTPYSFR